MESLRTKIIAVLTPNDASSLALSAEEIAAVLNKPVKQIRPRLTEMAKKGLIEKQAGGKVRPDGARRSSGLWQLKAQA